MRVGEAAKSTGWSPRMLRYLEATGLVVPERTRAGYRSYGLRELNQLRSLRKLRRRFVVDLDEVVVAARLRLHGRGVDALDWEQRKHERLLVA